MCELGVDRSSDWLMVDPWEAIQPEYMPTAQVLDHFEHEINEVLGGAERPDGTRAHVRIALLAGADLIQTMSTPGVWSAKDLDHICKYPELLGWFFFPELFHVHFCGPRTFNSNTATLSQRPYSDLNYSGSLRHVHC